MLSVFLQNCVFHLLNKSTNLIMLSATIEVFSVPFNTFYHIHFTQSGIFSQSSANRGGKVCRFLLGLQWVNLGLLLTLVHWLCLDYHIIILFLKYVVCILCTVCELPVFVEYLSCRNAANNRAHCTQYCIPHCTQYCIPQCLVSKSGIAFLM